VLATVRLSRGMVGAVSPPSTRSVCCWCDGVDCTGRRKATFGDEAERLNSMQGSKLGVRTTWLEAMVRAEVESGRFSNNMAQAMSSHPSRPNPTSQHGFKPCLIRRPSSSSFGPGDSVDDDLPTLCFHTSEPRQHASAHCPTALSEFQSLAGG